MLCPPSPPPHVHVGVRDRVYCTHSAPADIKRLMAYAPAMNSEFIVSYFGTLSREISIEVMREMLGKNMRQNLQMVVQIATAYSDQIGAESLMEMFASFKLYEGLFYYLGAIVNNSTVSVSSQLFLLFLLFVVVKKKSRSFLENIRKKVCCEIRAMWNMSREFY